MEGNRVNCEIGKELLAELSLFAPIDRGFIVDKNLPSHENFFLNVKFGSNFFYFVKSEFGGTLPFNAAFKGFGSNMLAERSNLRRLILIQTQKEFILFPPKKLS